MNHPKDELFAELLGKASQAQVGMWGSATNALAFIVGAASVIATVSEEGRGFVFYVISSGFIGILLLFLCFLHQKRMYVRMIERLPGFRKLSEEEKIQQIEEEIWRPSPVQRLEVLALFFFGLTALLFVAFCLIAFKLIE